MRRNEEREHMIIANLHSRSYFQNKHAHTLPETGRTCRFTYKPVTRPAGASRGLVRVFHREYRRTAAAADAPKQGRPGVTALYHERGARPAWLARSLSRCSMITLA